MKNDTYLNILLSYAYLGKDAEMTKLAISSAKNGEINLMIDSGAFTKHNAKSAFDHVNMDEYCTFLEKVSPYAEKYVMLDVVGNAEKSKENYETMIRRGFNPMFVATLFDKDYSYLREAVGNNPHLCVAGGVTTKGPWMIKRFQTIYKESGEKALIHGLGYVTFPKMFQLPLYSVDSSSWVAPARFGRLDYFDNGMKGIGCREVLRGQKKPTSKLKELLNEFRVTPAMFVREAIHHGQASLEMLSGIYSNIRMQRYCKRHGLDYFLAVATKTQVRQIMWVAENLNDISFEKFYNLFKS